MYNRKLMDIISNYVNLIIKQILFKNNVYVSTKKMEALSSQRITQRIQGATGSSYTGRGFILT